MRPIRIHDAAQARAALAAANAVGAPLVLVSAPEGAAALGAAVFREMVAEAVRVYPGVDVTAVLDCGHDPGLALAALREGVRAVSLDAPAEVLARVADIAGQVGAKVCLPEDRVLDLGTVDDAEAAARAWLDPGGPRPVAAGTRRG